MLVHNHPCSEMEQLLDPANRRLTGQQTSEVMKFLRYGSSSNRIRMMARIEYKKYLTRSDINNLRYRLMETAVPAGNIVVSFYMLSTQHAGGISSSWYLEVVTSPVRGMVMERLNAYLSVEMNRRICFDAIRRWCVQTPHTMLIATGKVWVFWH